jgi:hypothetical protein
MKESEILNFMLDSIKEDNYMMAQQVGMSEEEIKENFIKSEPSLSFMVVNLYNRMKEQGIIA